MFPDLIMIRDGDCVRSITESDLSSRRDEDAEVALCSVGKKL